MLIIQWLLASELHPPAQHFTSVLLRSPAEVSWDKGRHRCYDVPIKKKKLVSGYLMVFFSSRLFQAVEQRGFFPFSLRSRHWMITSGAKDLCKTASPTTKGIQEKQHLICRQLGKSQHTTGQAIECDVLLHSSKSYDLRVLWAGQAKNVVSCKQAKGGWAKWSNQSVV